MSKVIILHDLRSNDEIRVFTNRIKTYRIVKKESLDPACDSEFYNHKTGDIRKDFKEHSILFEDERELPYAVRELPHEIDEMINGSSIPLNQKNSFIIGATETIGAIDHLVSIIENKAIYCEMQDAITDLQVKANMLQDAVDLLSDKKGVI